MLINYYGNMDATKKNELILVSGLVILTFTLGYVGYKRLKEKGLLIKIGG